MDNENNINSTGVQLNLNNNTSLPNSDISVSDPMINLDKIDLSSKPQSEVNKISITSVFKHSGEITGYGLSNGEQIAKERGVKLAKAGTITGVSIGTSRKGEEYLRSLPDEDESNNLSSLPIIQK